MVLDCSIMLYVDFCDSSSGSGKAKRFKIELKNACVIVELLLHVVVYL
jgi:hypothetical protein